MPKHTLTLLEDMRASRTAARQLRARIESHTLTEPDGLRLVAQILGTFDRMNGQVELEARLYGAVNPVLARPADAPSMVLLDGGRP